MKANVRSGKLTGLSEKSSDIVLVVICAVILFLVAYPLYYVLAASVSDPYDVYAGKTFLLPSKFTLDGYKAVFSDPSILTGLLNSFKYTIIGTVFSVVVLYLAAYPLSIRDLPGRKFFSIFFIITMYFGGGMVPTYLVVKETGLINNMWALFLPGGVAVGNMIIVRNFFENSIPRAMTEAAEIDGAGKWKQFTAITLPAISPTTFYLLLAGVINGLLTFDIARIFTGESWSGAAGPKDMGLTSVLYIYYQGVQIRNMPVASVMSMVLFVIIMIVTIVNYKLGDKWVSYD